MVRVDQAATRGEVAEAMEAQVRVLIIVNTRTGEGDTGLYEFVRTLGSHGAEVTIRFSTGSIPLNGLAKDVDRFDRVVAVGGDGTVSTVCYETRGSGVPVLAYPAGTANLIALNLDLPIDAPGLAQVVLRGKPARFDIGELEHPSPSGCCDLTGFVMMAGAGFDATIMENASPLKATFGAAAYLFAAVSALAPTVSEFELVLDGEHIHTDGIAVLLVNFGRIQFELDVTPGWDPQDGLIEVVVLRTRSVAGLIPAIFSAMIDRVRGGGESIPSVDVYSAREIQVSAYPPLRMQSDGDPLEALTPFAARVLPGAATLLVPTESPYE